MQATSCGELTSSITHITLNHAFLHHKQCLKSWSNASPHRQPSASLLEICGRCHSLDKDRRVPLSYQHNDCIYLVVPCLAGTLDAGTDNNYRRIPCSGHINHFRWSLQDLQSWWCGIFPFTATLRSVGAMSSMLTTTPCESLQPPI